MNSLRFFASVFILSVICFNKAQADTIPVRKHIALQIAPLSLIDFYNGSCYKLGAEIRLFRNMYLAADAGGYFPKFNGLKNMKGGNLDVRLKYQFPNTTSAISISYFYKKQAFEYHDFYKEAPDVPVTVYTRKQINCINVNYENKVLDEKWGYVNAYAGLGIRFRNVQSSFETHHDFDRMVNGGDSQSLYFVLIPGQNTWLNLNLGLRMGFYLF